MTVMSAEADEMSTLGHVSGFASMPLNDTTRTLSPDGQKRFRLPGVGIVRVDVDKHVENALKQQAHDIEQRERRSKVTVRSK